MAARGVVARTGRTRIVLQGMERRGEGNDGGGSGGGEISLAVVVAAEQCNLNERVQST